MHSGRVSIVTGASRGIGAAVASAMTHDGYHVVAASRTASVDVRCEEDVSDLFATTLERFGRIDVVIHCAGVSYASLLVSLDDATLSDVLATNLTGSFLVAREAARVAHADMPVTLLLLGSLAQHGSPANASYALTKGGIRGLARAFSLAPFLRTHLLAVGYVDTELTNDLPERTRKLLVDTCPLKRASTASEAARAIVGVVRASPALGGSAPIYVSGGLMDFPT